MLFTYRGKASETQLGALCVSNNSVMEIKRLFCKPTSPEMLSAPFPLCFLTDSSTAVGRQGCQTQPRNREVGCRGEARGPCGDSIMLAVKRLIRIECSIDVKPPFAPAIGTLITGFPLWGIMWCNEMEFTLPGGPS